MPSEQEIKDVFATFENERDHKMPKRQVGVALRALGIAVSNAQITTLLETVKDTAVDFKTFQGLINMALPVALKSPSATLDGVQPLFAAGDGKINLVDLKQVLSVVGERLEDDEIEEFLQSIKTDKNGNVSMTDLSALFETIK